MSERTERKRKRKVTKLIRNAQNGEIDRQWLPDVACEEANPPYNSWYKNSVHNKTESWTQQTNHPTWPKRNTNDPTIPYHVLSVKIKHKWPTHLPSSHSRWGSVVGVGGSAIKIRLYQNSPTSSLKKMRLKYFSQQSDVELTGKTVGSQLTFNKTTKIVFRFKATSETNKNKWRPE